MADEVVGYGPGRDFGPTVPSFLVVRDGDGRTKVVTRDGDSRIPPERVSDRTVQCSPEPMQAGMWPLLFSPEDIGHPRATEWYPLSEEARWLPARAKSLLSEGSSVRGRPELALRTVRAASAMVSLDIDKVVKELSAHAFHGESLDETYERRRGLGPQ